MPKEEGADAQAARTETLPAFVLGLRLADQPEFWTHAAEVRAGGDVVGLARRYVRRDQGRRVELIVGYLKLAADGLEVGHTYAKAAVMNIAPPVWWAGAPTPSDPRAPVRTLRDDACDSMNRAALRVARRGAGRCADPDCGGWDRRMPWTDATGGARLASDNRSDYCSACAKRHRDPRRDIEQERVLFDRAIAAVLGGNSRA